MTRLGLVFWSVAGIEAALLAVLCVVSLGDDAGRHDGGRTMGLFFYVLLPALVFGAAMLLFHFSASWPMRAAALLIIVAPGLWFAQARVGDWLVGRRIEANRKGTG